MSIVNKKGCIYLFTLMVFSYFLFPNLGFCLSSSIEETTSETSLLEGTHSSVLLAKAKKKKKKGKKKKGNKQAKESKESKASTSNNSYWGIGGGYLFNLGKVGTVYAELRKDLFSNIFVYLQGKYTLWCGEYFSLYGGEIGALYSYRMSDFIEIAGGAGFLVNMFNISDESKMKDVYVNSSAQVPSMTLMYADPRLSVSLHFTQMVAVTLEAGAVVNVAGAEEEVVEKVKPYIDTEFYVGVGTMLTL